MHDVATADRDQVELAGQLCTTVRRRRPERLDIHSSTHRNRVQTAPWRVGANDRVGQAPADLVLEDPREEEVAEVRDVERPPDPDPRSADVRQVSANRLGGSSVSTAPVYA